MRILFFLLISISFLESGGQTADTYSICEKALSTIKEKDYIGFKSLFHVAVIKNANDSVIRQLVDQGADFIKKYGLPPKEMIMVKYQTSYMKDGQVQMILFDYPFPAPKEKHTMPDRVISFGFIEKFGMDSLSSFNIKDYAASDSIMTALMSKLPFMEKLDFNAKDISWFRIYYSRGSVVNKIGNEEGVFAVSGDKDKLDSLKIEAELKKIFGLLEKAHIEKTNYKYGGSPKSNGKPEYIYFRFKFNTPPVEKFDELTIKVIIEEEKGVKEDDYIFISHNQMNRYYISKSKNPELFKLLKGLAYKNYGNKLEKNPKPRTDETVRNIT
jgi:hypothetical protein